MSDAEPRVVDEDVRRHLTHLKVERRLAERTLALYADAFERLQRGAEESKVALRKVQPHHIRRWAGQAHGARSLRARKTRCSSAVGCTTPSRWKGR